MFSQGNDSAVEEAPETDQSQLSPCQNVRMTLLPSGFYVTVLQILLIFLPTSQVVVAHPAWNIPEAHKFSLSKSIRDPLQTQLKRQIILLVIRFKFKYFYVFEQGMFTPFKKLAKLQMKAEGLLFSLESWLL